MRWILAFSFAACGLLVSSCGTSKPPTAEERSRLTDNQAEVYIGARYRGLTPREVRVRRSFGETSVTLRRGKEVLRSIEIAWSERSGSYLPYLFGVDTEGDALVYDIEDLERSRKDSTYTVPHLGVPVKIRDRKYGLTLWVED